MLKFVPNKEHSRRALIFCFHLKKTAVESYRLLREAYGKHALSQDTCERWFQCFKSGDFDVADKEHGKPSKRYEDAELQELLDEGDVQTQKQLAEQLSVSQQAVFNRLRDLGKIQKVGKSVPHVSVPLEGSTSSSLPLPEKKPRIQSNIQQKQQQHEYHQYQQQQSQQPQNRRNKSRRSRKPYKSRPPAPPPLQSNLISPPSLVIIRNESPIEIRSDDDSRDIQMFEVNVDPSLYFPPDSENSQENSTESLVMSLVGSDNKRGRRGGRGRGSKSKSFSSLDNNHPLMKVREKQRRKEAHIKLHTDRDAEQDFLIMNQSDHDILDICDLRRNSSGVSNRDGDNSKNGFVFDAETLKAQFPLVAIIDDNSNDDAIWAEFKVVESPTRDRSYNNILNQIHTTDEDINCGIQVENQNESGKKGKKKGTKLEKVSNILGNEEVKKEPIDLDTLEVIQDSPEKSEENTQTRIEKPSMEDTASVTIKIEPELIDNEPLQMPGVREISSTEEYEKINKTR